LRPDAATAPHGFDSYLDCYFEAMSGLTTTGATILEAIGTVPPSLLLWRSLTQWLGGLGIVVLFVAVFPMLGVGGRRIFRIEAAGPTPEGVRPRIQEAARVLWMMYVGLTLVEIVALKICGMSWFDSVCHTFTTLATGGFSTLDASVAGYHSTAIHIIFIVFMFLAGVNFGLYYQLLKGQWRSVRKDPELRIYVGIILVATVFITLSILSNRPPAYAATADSEAAPVGTVIRDSVFQVVSLQTTTGFATSDFDTWGFLAKATLVILMFVGGCAGSTGGGIKVTRIMIGVKIMIAELEHAFRPSVVRTVRVGRSVIDADLKISTLAYLLGIVVLFALGTIVLMALEVDNGIDMTSAATASAATLNNIGPGLGKVGATQNYAWFSEASKAVMCVLMVLGRLEVLTVVVLFMPRFWRAE
jgi:trk system potassium uptake protein TrkH